MHIHNPQPSKRARATYSRADTRTPESENHLILQGTFGQCFLCNFWPFFLAFFLKVSRNEKYFTDSRQKLPMVAGTLKPGNRETHPGLLD